MPKIPLTTSTHWLEAHSDGALPTLYETHSDLNVWKTLPDVDIFHSNEPNFQLSVEDETTDGNVRILTRIDFDALDINDASSEIWSRMLCIYIVNRLAGKALDDASESLIDIYNWQIDQSNQVLKIPEKHRHGVTSIRNVERTPIILEDG